MLYIHVVPEVCAKRCKNVGSATRHDFLSQFMCPSTSAKEATCMHLITTLVGPWVHRILA